MAKITRVEIMMVDLKPTNVRVDAIQSFVSQETPLVRITDSDGAIGVGYSYTIGTGGHAVIDLLRRTFAPALIGRDPAHIERIWRDLLYLSHATSVGAITSLALAAIDIALWDMKGKKACLPLHVLAGGAHDSRPLYTTEGGWLHLPIEAIVENILNAQADGFKGAKIKVGLSVAEDVQRLKAAREAVGDTFEIFTDVNQALTLDMGLRRAAAYAPYGIGWLEEPFPADDIASHKVLSDHSHIPVAVGESLYSLRQFNAYLAAGACSIVQVDVARVGGITPWLKVAHMAESFNVAVCPHFLMEIHVALCCAVPNAHWVEYIPQLESITIEGMNIGEGLAYPSLEPGIGIQWDWKAIAASRVDDATFTVS